jgi:hypothetical protein
VLRRPAECGRNSWRTPAGRSPIRPLPFRRKDVAKAGTSPRTAGDEPVTPSGGELRRCRDGDRPDSPCSGRRSLGARMFPENPAWGHRREQRVNNFPAPGRAAGYSRGAVSILGGTTGGLSPGPGGESPRSLIEQSRARRPENPAESATGIRPGNRGKGGRSWCVRPLRGASRDRHVSPVPLDGVATDPVLRLRNCAARRELRNRVRAESGPGPVSRPAPMQLPRGLRLLLHDQSAAVRPGRFRPSTRPG